MDANCRIILFQTNTYTFVTELYHILIFRGFNIFLHHKFYLSRIHIFILNIDIPLRSILIKLLKHQIMSMKNTDFKQFYVVELYAYSILRRMCTKGQRLNR